MRWPLSAFHLTNRAPLITAIVLLLLPVPYVGSYLALVVPEAHAVLVVFRGGGQQHYVYKNINYRWHVAVFPRLFWPLEQIDRKVRPNARAVGDLRRSVSNF